MARRSTSGAHGRHGHLRRGWRHVLLRGPHPPAPLERTPHPPRGTTECSPWPSCWRGLLRVALGKFREGTLGRPLWKSFRASKDPSLFIVLAEDLAALVGLVIAFLGVLLGHLTGNHVFDGVASLLIGVLLSAVALLLGRETGGLLLGESAAAELVQKIDNVVRADPAVERSGRPLTDAARPLGGARERGRRLPPGALAGGHRGRGRAARAAHPRGPPHHPAGLHRSGAAREARAARARVGVGTDGRYGRAQYVHGKREKLRLRFCTKASRPSWASSVP